MIRRIALTLATTLAFVLVACGDKAEPNANDATKNVASSQPAVNTAPPPPPETPPAPAAALPAAPAPAAGGW